MPFAIAVIMVHSGRLTSYEPVHFALKSILGRMAVPFLSSVLAFPQAITKGFEENEGLSGQNHKNLTFWSCVYLPLCLVLFSESQPPSISLSSWRPHRSGLFGDVLPTLVYQLFARFVGQSTGQAAWAWFGEG